MPTLIMKPVDVLMLRGNRLFGGAVHGRAHMPPWPSVVCGAVASRALIDRGKGYALTSSPDRAFEILDEELGADFALKHVLVAHRGHLWCPLPGDLLATGNGADGYFVHPIEARKLPEGTFSSCALARIPVAVAGDRRKPAASMWLRLDGFAEHLSGRTPDSSRVIGSEALWAMDPRLGIALDRRMRTAIPGAIYTTDAVALSQDVSIVAQFQGAHLPENGLVRLGGDGRAAELQPADENAEREIEALGVPQPDWSGFRMILASPGIFPNGWLPPGIGKDNVFSIDGLRARVVCASLGRHDVISGWDLAMHAPKPAQKVVPAGACYWFEVLEGDTAVLRSIRERGLWPLIREDADISRRKREGWNHVWFGNWSS